MAKKEGVKGNLDKVRLGVASGFVFAIFVLTVTLFSEMLPGWFELAMEAYGSLGYSSNLIGMILGMLYGFVDGFVLGFIFAFIYNKI